MNDSLPQGGAARGLSAFTLKLLAIFGMTLDHIATVFGGSLSLPAETALHALGGLTFPIMAFLLVEGYKHTTNFKRYALRLLVFAVIAAAPFMWAMGALRLNIMFTLLLGLITLYLHDNMKKRVLFWLVFVGVILATYFMDWSLIGVPMVLLYHTLRRKWARVTIPVLLLVGLLAVQLAAVWATPSMALVSQLPFVAYTFIGCGLTIPLLAGYNGARGRSMKYFFYAYYPAHLLILALIRTYLSK